MFDPIWLVISLLVILIIQSLHLIIRKPKILIDREAISTAISDAVTNTIMRIAEEMGKAIGKLEEFDRNLTMIRESLPENVRKHVSELRDHLVEFRDELNDLPSRILRSVQSSIDVRKGRVGELATLMRLLGEYERIIPLGKPVDFIGIGEHIDFIETKTGVSGLTDEQKKIRDLIQARKVRFILRREEVEISTPEEVEVSKLISEKVIEPLAHKLKEGEKT